MKIFFWGIIFTLAALTAGAYVSVIKGWVPANADDKPSALETWAAHKSLHATLLREAPKTAVPVALTDANVIDGIHLYKTNCAVCHGSSDGQASNIATGLFQHAPQLARHSVTDDAEGKIYWFIKHGVRLTGMPAFTDSLTDKQIWDIVLFLKHMDNLPPKADKAWKAVHSAKM